MLLIIYIKREENLNSISLLYVEDDQDIQRIYIDFLEKYVDRVLLANDGEEGYKLYLNERPDILLLDINMPKLDGLSLAKKIRESDKNVKIIITTSYGEQENLLKAIELYLIKYILKPIDFNELEKALTKAIKEIRSEMMKGEEVFYLDDESVWHKESEKLFCQNVEVKLTKNERRLLSLFSTNENKVFTFFEIFDHISYDNFDKDYDANQVRALVKLLRKKIPKEAIINVYGEGYRFNPLKKEMI